MNLLVLAIIAGAMVVLRFLRLNTLAWLVVWWIATYVTFKYSVDPPLPSSIVSMFMGIVTFSLLAYASADSKTMTSVTRPVLNFIVDRRYTVPLVIVVLLLPALVAFNALMNMSSKIQPPVFGRTIHPAPPGTITFNGKQIDLIGGDNPYRELETTDAESFQAHVANGRRVYYQNCVFCHGDDMKGNGIYSHGLDPFPADFADATTIAMLQESYLFWRIAKGAPGLPEESAPWASAMPAWERFLSEEKIWDVILFLYDYTGQKPRAREHVE